MKTTLSLIAIFLFATSAIAADCSIEWQQTVPLLTAPQAIATVGDKEITLRPIQPEKKNDPPRAGLFVGDKRVTKSPLWLNRQYAFAVTSAAGKTQWYVNGYPEPDAGNDALAPVVAANGAHLKISDSALSADQVLAHFKQLIGTRSIVTVGHRGDNHGSPENTNISYANAIANKTPIVEMDLRLTKDNVLVLLHDPTVNRTTNGKGPIVEKTLEEAQQLDAGTWKDAKYKGEKIPTVEAICNTCRGKAVMMLDLKCTGLGKSLAELKEKLNYPSDAWILAPWEDQEGVELRKYLPADMPMIRLTGKVPTDNYDDAYFDRMKKIGFSWFSINWQNVSQDFIDAAHKHDMKIYLWTVNDPIDIAGGVLANVDGIITDDVPSTMKIVSDLTTR